MKETDKAEQSAPQAPRRRKGAGPHQQAAPKEGLFHILFRRCKRRAGTHGARAKLQAERYEKFRSPPRLRPLSSPRSDSGPFSARPQTALRPTTPDHPTGRGQPSFLLPTTRRRPLAKLRPATLRPTFRRPAASHRPSAALLPAADPSPSRCRTAARRANAARTCFCLFLRAACTIFVALPGPHLARPLHGRPGAGHKPLSPA